MCNGFVSRELQVAGWRCSESLELVVSYNTIRASFVSTLELIDQLSLFHLCCRLFTSFTFFTSRSTLLLISPELTAG